MMTHATRTRTKTSLVQKQTQWLTCEALVNFSPLHHASTNPLNQLVCLACKLWQLRTTASLPHFWKCHMRKSGVLPTLPVFAVVHVDLLAVLHHFSTQSKIKLNYYHNKSINTVALVPTPTTTTT